MRFIIGLLVISAFGRFLTAAEPAVSRQASPEALIRQLEDRDFKVRDAAAKAIEALGPKALPALRKAAASTNPGVREQVARWITRFDNDVLLQPKCVTLRLQQRMSSEALNELGKSAGYAFQLYDRESRTGTRRDLHLEVVPFWEAFDKICSQGGIHFLDVQTSESALDVIRDGHFAPFASYHGAFRTAVTRLCYQHQRDVQLGQIPIKGALQRTSSESLTLSLTIDAEPKIRLIACRTVEITHVDDDRGQELKMIGKPVTEPPGSANTSGCQSYRQKAGADVFFPPASPGATHLRRVKGRFAIVVACDRRLRLFSDKDLGMSGRRDDIDGLHVELGPLEATPAGDHRVSVSISGANAEEWDNTCSLLELVDGAGNRHPFRDIETSVRRSDCVVSSLTFPPGVAGPVKLQHTYWKRVSCEVPFEFQNLPLP